MYVKKYLKKKIIILYSVKMKFINSTILVLGDVSCMLVSNTWQTDLDFTKLSDH